MGATAGLFALQGAQTVLSFSADQQQASAARAQGAYAGAAADMNAKVATLQAQDAIARGDLAAHEEGARTRGEMGAARAAAAAQGLDVGSGSALDVQANTATIGALDEATIRNNAARAAWGYTTEAADYRQQGKLARAAGANAGLGYAAEGVTTLLTGAGKTYGLYRQHQAGTL